MIKNILITGGAGFIGSHLADKLIENPDYNVIIIDILEEQVHGKLFKPPDYLNKSVKFYQGSITNKRLIESLVEKTDIIFHLAAMVGVSQSMFEINKYTYNNIYGTSNLIETIINFNPEIEKIIIASSNTVYGESKANCPNCGVFFPKMRTNIQLINREWEIRCPNCKSLAKPIPCDENTPFNPNSIYALSKQVQEQIGLMIGKTYNIDTTILRFFLVYGSRQALSNPYTGVCGIFSSRCLMNKSPIIFEDGNQLRDFIHVSDVCQALILAMRNTESKGEIFNVASGNPITIKEVAKTIIEKIKPSLKPIYSQKYRIGDVRHCIADISKIKNRLGFKPKIRFKEGIEEYIEWIKNQNLSEIRLLDSVNEELMRKGLLM